MRQEHFIEEKSRTVLLLIDVINDLAFPTGRKLLRHGLPAARHTARLKARAARAGIPAIYVNDNFGRWRSDFRNQIDHCLGEKSLGREITRLLVPDENDYFVLKPRHSGFFSTTLEVLLDYLGAEKLILTGFASDICVLYTANDAYLRGYEIIVARDCVAAETAAANATALHQMRRNLHARICPGRDIRLRK